MEKILLPRLCTYKSDMTALVVHSWVPLTGVLLAAAAQATPRRE